MRNERTVKSGASFTTADHDSKQPEISGKKYNFSHHLSYWRFLSLHSPPIAAILQIHTVSLHCFTVKTVQEYAWN